MIDFMDRLKVQMQSSEALQAFFSLTDCPILDLKVAHNLEVKVENRLAEKTLRKRLTRLKSKPKFKFKWKPRKFKKSLFKKFIAHPIHLFKFPKLT